MRIWLSGAHSSGKSTLARYISQKYKLPMISEAARMILSENEQDINTLRYDLDTVDNYQRQVFNRQLIEEQKHFAFVSDRSALDAMAYSCAHSRIFPELLASPDLQPYLDGLRAPNSIYFFVSPCHETLAEDGVREVINWESIVSIHAMLKVLLEMFGIRYFSISTSSMIERVKLIDSVLSIK
jgi:nicotinamide riboside kinase